jgi:hypothetical protein
MQLTMLIETVLTVLGELAVLKYSVLLYQYIYIYIYIYVCVCV